MDLGWGGEKRERCQYRRFFESSGWPTDSYIRFKLLHRIYIFAPLFRVSDLVGDWIVSAKLGERHRLLRARGFLSAQLLCTCYRKSEYTRSYTQLM